MTETKLEIGDIVMLKHHVHHQPTMVVVDMTGAMRIKCSWWSTKDSEFKFVEFPTAALVKAPKK